jgi:hypothetical protein
MVTSLIGEVVCGRQTGEVTKKYFFQSSPINLVAQLRTSLPLRI